MNNLDSKKLRHMWREFYRERGHAVISSASLIPENDPTVLFTTAGMHPLVPYLMGEKHPGGRRLCNVQKCVRTGDIDSVGDATHCTFFEMLGNWSLGDYFKDEKIRWSYLFITDPNYLGIDKNNIAVSVFAGDNDCPRDDVSAQAWLSCGIDKERIFYLPKENNWWGPAGTTGPCGPDTEMFMIFKDKPCSEDCSPACDCGRYVEIGNDVFMQYYKSAEGTFTPLQQKNVDTGMGLERILCVIGGKKSVYEIDLFVPIISKIETLSGQKYGENDKNTRAMRIIADHIRTSVHLIGDERGIVCSNVDQGYILRRLLRRAMRYCRVIGLEPSNLPQVAAVVIDIYKEDYPELQTNRDKILTEISQENERFNRTLTQGIKEFEKLTDGMCAGGVISGTDAFRLYDTYGFPVEMTAELAAEHALTVDKDGFELAFREHQNKSRGEGSFKGGLADGGQLTARLHTATHLMHAGLRKVLNDENAAQKGSNITPERLRFDFTFNRPLTEDEIKAVEQYVNDAIAADVIVTCDEMSVDDALKSGAIGLFTAKYGEKVKVYGMGGFSREICGGPHAARTGELGKFSIVKEQSSSAGVRRIKAILE